MNRLYNLTLPKKLCTPYPKIGRVNLAMAFIFA